MLTVISLVNGHYGDKIVLNMDMNKSRHSCKLLLGNNML